MQSDHQVLMIENYKHLRNLIASIITYKKIHHLQSLPLIILCFSLLSQEWYINIDQLVLLGIPRRKNEKFISQRASDKLTYSRKENRSSLSLDSNISQGERSIPNSNGRSICLNNSKIHQSTRAKMKR